MTPIKASGPQSDSQLVTLQGDFSKRLVTNTFFNLLGRCWNFVIALLLTPYILAHLTVHEFGTWVVLSVFISSFNMLDLGLGSAFVKHVAEYHAHGDFARINRILFSGVLFYSVFSVVQVSLGLMLEKPLFRMLNLSGASDAYLLVLISCAISNLAAMSLSVFRGIQRMDKSNSLEIRISLANAVGTVLALQAGFGIRGLAANAVVNACFALIVSWLSLRRLIPQLGLAWSVDLTLLRAVFAYGLKMQVSQIGGLICFRADKLIVSRFLGMSAVSFYEVSSRLTSFMRSVPLVMISALIPVTSELDARNNREKILRTYGLASKYIAILTTAIAAFLIAEADSVITLWLGHGFTNSVILVQILAIGYAVNVLGGPASQTAAGIGRPEFDMRSTALVSVLNPVLSVLLVRKFGAPGAAAGTTLAFVFGTAYLLVTFHRRYVESPASAVLLDIYIRPMTAAVFAALAISGLHSLTPQLHAWAGIRYLIPFKIAVDFGVFAPVYLLLLITFRQVNAIDWSNFRGLISFSFEFLRHPFRERVKIYR